MLGDGSKKKLRQFLKDHPEQMQVFAQCFKEVRNPCLALARMGFARHPLVQQAIARAGTRALGRHLRPWVVRLLYHNDLETMFTDSIT